MKLWSTAAGLLACAIAGTCATSPALAGAFALREQGATGQGMSFAGVAAGSGGLSSTFWNPATITMSPGWQSYSSVTLIDVEASIKTLPGTSPLLGTQSSGVFGEVAAAPASYFSYQLDDRWWIGLGVNAPFGLVTKPNAEWSGQIYARTSRVYTTSFNPIIGLKVNEWLSLGAGPTIDYFQVKLKQSTSFLPGGQSGELRTHGTSAGWTAGATLTPLDGTTIGIGYRSSVLQEPRGRLNTIAAVTPIKAHLNMPDMLTVGLSQVITPEFRVNLGYEWMNWSRLGYVSHVATAGPAAGAVVTALPLRYKDGHYASVGAEYDLDPRWTLRAGLGYEWSPVSDTTRLPSVPDSNRWLASVGTTYKWTDKLTFDLAYTHMMPDRAPIRITAGNPSLISVGSLSLPYVGVAKGHISVVSMAIRYRWDDPKVSQPVLSAKY